MFPNAYNGVKKIYTAELLSLIGTICLLIAAILVLVGIAASTVSDGTAVAGVVGGGFLGIAASVLMFISFIMNLVGLSNAAKDETAFKNALIVSVVGIVASVAMGAIPSGSLVADLCETVTQICQLLVTLLVCNGIINLAQRMGEPAMAEKGNTARKMLMAMWIVAIVVDIVSTLIDRGGTPSTISSILSIVALVVSIVSYIFYLRLLSSARTMLAK
ncbi:MAG: hypothetical protein E7427_03080 [Ruminococcaceae bacterium]|nr:hypothetical protein [Oscillospiraceae bacterium]